MKFAKSKYPESMIPRKRILPSNQPLKYSSLSIFERPLSIENQQQTLQPKQPQYQEPIQPYPQPMQQIPQSNAQIVNHLLQVSSPIRPINIQCPYCRLKGKLK